MTIEFNEALYALIGAIVTLVLTNILKWISEKKDRTRTKTAEYYSALSKYVDYLITVSFYNELYLNSQREKVFSHLEVLKSQLIESQCLLAAFNIKVYSKTKKTVSEAIMIDGQITEAIFEENVTEDLLQSLNNRASELIKEIQNFLEETLTM